MKTVWAAVALGLPLLLGGCAGTPGADGRQSPAAQAGIQPLPEADLRWLNRVSFGVDSELVARYRKLGRERFLDEQLNPPRGDPQVLADEIATLPTTQASAEQQYRALRAEQQRIQKLPPEEAQPARDAQNKANNQVVYEVSRRHLMRALRSPAQLQEVMTWFWMNHFNVYSGKANVRWTIGEYEDRSVRPNALGKFSTLVTATLRSPAMLEYLDNAQSAANRVNENYARELMELQVLGVSGGPSGSTYSQKDVQELARVLTGAGIDYDGLVPRLTPERASLYIRDGLFEFDPNRHDFGQKVVLGQTISGRGFSEVDDAVQLLCRQPAAARFISAKLATFFVGDDPPSALVDRMTTSFTRSGGDIAAVLRTLLLDPAFDRAIADRPSRLKDPMMFVASSLRLAYDGKVLTNYRPVLGWLYQLGEPLYGRVTPDGYALTEAAWASSGQMVKRFEIARAIGGGNAGLFRTDDDKPGPRTGFPVINSALYYAAVEPTLEPSTRGTLDQATSQQEWNTLLLASPDWMQR
ncbi:DUF1800 domain-containing protein [soil metagenome]